MSMPYDLLGMQHLPGWIIIPGILLILVASLIARDRSEPGRIPDEADSKDAEVPSIRWCWLPFRYGPFSWWGRL